MKAIGYFASLKHDADYARYGDTPEEAIENCKDAFESYGYDTYKEDDIEVFAVHSKATVSTKTVINWGAE